MPGLVPSDHGSLEVLIDDVAGAYGRTLLDGDRRFGRRSIDKYVLHAVVASSISQTLEWTATRLPNGPAISAPLEALAPRIQAGDTLGKALALLRREARAQTTKLLLSLFVPGSILAGLVVVLVHSFGSVFDFGQLVGGTILPTVTALGLTAFVGYGFSFALQAFARGAESAFNLTNVIGVDAERVFDAEARPALTALYASCDVPLPPLQQLATIRNLARIVVVMVYALLGGALLFFLVGALSS